MATQSRSPSTGFSWLSSGFTVGFRHPKPLIGGALFMLLAFAIPVLINLGMQYHAVHTEGQLTPAKLGWITLVASLLNLLLVPLQGGYLQIVEAAECNRLPRARDIFAPYQSTEALRLIGYGLMMLLIYLVVVGIVAVTLGGGFLNWQSHALTAQLNHQPPAPGLPAHFWLFMLTLLLAGPLLLGLFAIGLGQVALNKHGVFSAIADGIVGMFKNLLPLLTMGVSVILLWIAAAIVIGIAVLLLAFIAKLLGAWLMIVVLIPLYIAFLFFMFTSMFGVTYHIWRDVCSTDTMMGSAQPIAA